MEEGKGPMFVRKKGETKVLPQALLQLLVLFLFSFSITSIYMIKHFGNQSSKIAANPNLLHSNVEEVENLEEWINPAFNLMHSMSDKELLLRASSMPRMKKNRVSKIAFMFLSEGMLPLAPLWERFFKGHDGRYSIYIHSSPSFRPHYPSSSVFYKRQVPSKVSEWGTMTMCDAERRLLANALLNDISNEWFVLVSESCIPLYKFNVIHNYITQSKYSFIGAFDDPWSYERGHNNNEISVLLANADKATWRKGSQWFEINRDLALYIVRDTKLYSTFDEFCRPPCYPDEHYFSTLLTIQAAHLLANRSTTWVDWTRGGPHPATFGGEDITEELIKRMYEDHSCLYNDDDEPSSICYLFARKFSPSSLEALFLIAPIYLGF